MAYADLGRFNPARSKSRIEDLTEDLLKRRMAYEVQVIDTLRARICVAEVRAHITDIAAGGGEVNLKSLCDACNSWPTPAHSTSQPA